MSKKMTGLILVALFLLFSCSSGKPPEDLFYDNIRKMVLIDREMGFQEEVTAMTILDRVAYEDQVEVAVRVEGWAVHKTLSIGAVLPASEVRRAGWATWKFFCRKKDKTWIIEEKFKVAEGFGEG